MTLNLWLRGGTAIAAAIWVAAQSAERPAPLGSGRLVYDEDRQRVVLLDAVASTSPTTETARLRSWTWDGRQWELLPGTGPGWRVVGAAVYDTRRRRAVMYGGATIPATASLDETWESDGDTWTQAGSAGGVGRDHHSMAYDIARGRVVLFGGGTFARGRPYEFRTETREWNGATWRQVAAEGPGGRGLTTLAYDRQRNQVLLFGGQGPLRPGIDRPMYADTWVWNGDAWRRVAEGGPPPRYGHAMAFDARAGVMLLYGGNAAGDRPLTDLWQWDGQRWSEIATVGPTPGPRYWASMVHDIARGRTVLFGGRRGETAVWEWDGRRWERIEPASAAQRFALRVNP